MTGLEKLAVMEEASKSSGSREAVVVRMAAHLPFQSKLMGIQASLPTAAAAAAEVAEYAALLSYSCPHRELERAPQELAQSSEALWELLSPPLPVNCYPHLSEKDPRSEVSQCCSPQSSHLRRWAPRGVTSSATMSKQIAPSLVFQRLCRVGIGIEHSTQLQRELPLPPSPYRACNVKEGCCF